MASLLDLDIEPPCVLMSTIKLDSFTPSSMASTERVLQEQEPSGDDKVNNGENRTDTPPGGSRNSITQIPVIGKLNPKNTTASRAYTMPSRPESQKSGPPKGYVSSLNVRRLHEPALIPFSALEDSYAYALDRGHGQYTRLVPADRLPAMEGLPKFQGPEGLIILPTPRPGARFGSFADRHFTNGPSVIGEGRPRSKTGQTPDTVQNKIDEIVATLPECEEVVPKARKIKVYCDKWLHNGTCAFTQQGCRYKHEMPMDKDTQMQVGLFNGLPYWYRRQQAMDAKSRSTSSSGNNSTFSRGGTTEPSINMARHRGRESYSAVLRSSVSHAPGTPTTLPSSGRLFAQSATADFHSRAYSNGSSPHSQFGPLASANHYNVLYRLGGVKESEA